MPQPRACCPLVTILLLVASSATARTWTDVTSRYTLDAELIAFNDSTVVLQRADHELAAVPIDKLSQADREFLKSKEAADARDGLGKQPQTWTMSDGIKVVGKVVDFTRKDVTIQRRRGRIYVNDRVFDNLPQIYQEMLPRIVNHFEHINPVDKFGLESWAIRQRAQPRTFQLEGVVMEFENGDEYAIPFFFFSPGGPGPAPGRLERMARRPRRLRPPRESGVSPAVARRCATARRQGAAPDRHDAAQSASSRSRPHLAMGGDALPGPRQQQPAPMGRRPRPR